MATLTIITQNLDGNGRGKKLKGKNLESLKKKIKEDIDKSNFIKDQPEAKKSVDKAPGIEDLKLTISECIKENYMDKYGKEIIYAFQELGNKEEGARKTSYITRTIVPECYHKDTGVSGRAEEIWDEVFPWAEFVSGYWDECDIQFAGKKIKIINFHSSPKHDLGIRYTLLRRISEIPKNRLVILLGDFNAAFLGQMNKKYKNFIRNKDFLEKITNYGFRECLSDEESADTQHHTHSVGKVDHIFISESWFNLRWDSNPEKDNKPYTIEYIDEFNIKSKSPLKTAFTNHSGIKLTINLPDA